MQPITAPSKNWTRSSDLMLPQVEFESTYSDNRNHDGESTTNHHPDTKNPQTACNYNRSKSYEEPTGSSVILIASFN